MKTCKECLYFVQEVNDIKKIYIRQKGICLLDGMKHKSICKKCRNRIFKEQKNHLDIFIRGFRHF